MRCPRCDAENRAVARFCRRCDARLASACPVCGNQAEPASRFCDVCGVSLFDAVAPPTPLDRFSAPGNYTPKHLAERILSHRSAIEGEHKQVTVLFCDLVNSTALASRLGPEGMHGLLSEFFELALSEIHRFEGTVNQFLGDGFMALFGAPLAYEDHAKRAALAAIGLRRALADRNAKASSAGGFEILARMGLNTGVVVVGEIGDNLRMDYTAVGETTHVAARLQQLADPDAILVSENTWRLARDQIRVEAIPPLYVKGRSEPISAYRAVGLETRRSPALRLSTRPLSEFVGRTRELDTLEQLLTDVEAGRGQAIGIVAEPGMGKSRLLFEFRKRISSDRVTYLEGRCLAYGRGIPYLLVLDILRNNCGILDTDTPELMSAKVRTALTEAGVESTDHIACLLQLLGVKENTDTLALLSAEATKAKTFEALREMSVKGSRRRPLILALEDLHSVDNTSEEFFQFLAESLVHAPILILSTYRPGYLPPWTTKSYATQITLRPLSRSESLSVIHSVVSQVSETEAELIVSKTDGNPFFLEELAAALRDRQSLPQGLSIPETVHGILAARIDRLDSDPKRLLQMAAVLGREFSPALLQEVWGASTTIEPHLRQLTQLEFLYRQTVSDEPTYVFKHALTHEVVYAGLLDTTRRAYHGAAGSTLERLYSNRLDSVVELLAYHFGHSNDIEKAVDYSTAAAEKAQKRWANTEALSHFADAFTRLQRLPDNDRNRLRRIDAVVKQSEVKFALGHHTEQIQALEGIASLVESADTLRRASWHYWKGFLNSLTGSRPAAAIADCRIAIEIAEEEGFEEISASAHACLAQALTVAGHLAEAIEAGNRALAIFEATGNIWWACRTLWILISAANAQGDWPRSFAYSRRALDYGVELNDLRLKVNGWWRTAGTHILRGETESGLRCCETALSLSPPMFDVAAVKAVQGYGFVKSGDLKRGVTQLEEAVAWFGESGLRYNWSIYGLRLAEGYLHQGSTHRAAPLLQSLLKHSREAGYRNHEGNVLLLLAQSLPQTERATALDLIDQALRILQEVGARNDVARALTTKGTILRDLGDMTSARTLLNQSLSLFEELQTMDGIHIVGQILADLERH